MKARRKLLAIGLAFVFIVGCGSGDDSPPESLPTSAPANLQVRTAPTQQPIVGLDDAHRAHRDGRFEDAAAAFERFADEAGDATERANARLGAAIAWYDASETERGFDNLRDAYNAAPDDSQVRRRAGYLLGLRLTAAGDTELAANVLQPLSAAVHNDALQPHIDAAYASAALDAGEDAIADEAWDQALASPAIGQRLRDAILRERANLAADEQGYDEAADWMTRLLDDGEPTAADHFLAADIARNLGDNDAWAGQLRRIIADHPGSRLALQAIDILDRNDEFVDLGHSGYVYYRHGRYADARETLTGAIEEDGLADGQRAFRLYYLAASYDDDGMHAESIPLYDEAVSERPWSTLAYRARYWAAVAAEATGDIEDAASRYARVAQDGPAGPFFDEAIFRAGYLLLDSGEPQAAVAAWADLEHLDEHPRSLYWMGRAHEMIGDEGAAREAFERARDGHPFSFHGREAARRLGDDVDDTTGYEPVEEAGEPDWDAIASWLAGDDLATAPDAAQTAADDFAAMGMRNQARQLIRDADVEPLARLRAAWELELTDVVAREAQRMLDDADEPSHEAPRSLLQLAYPLSYVTSLNDIGAQYGVDPLFIAAIVRVESFWDPRAVSFAGARGLTQVMPGTGGDIATSLGHDDWDVADLFRPIVSLQYGAYYIAAQIDAFEDPYLALAAYNGGPGNAARWNEATESSLPADLLEQVDFAETQRYLQYVTTAYAHYRLAYR